MAIGEHLTRVNLIVSKKNWKALKIMAAHQETSASKLFDLFVDALTDETSPVVQKAFDKWKAQRK